MQGATGTRASGGWYRFAPPWNPLSTFLSRRLRETSTCSTWFSVASIYAGNGSFFAALTILKLLRGLIELPISCVQVMAPLDPI